MLHLKPRALARPHTLCLLAGTLAAALVTPLSQAEVSADEAATLKTTLTPFGAERAGNKDGSIPDWTGKPTPGADIGPDHRRKDPFANEKPLYTVTAKNLDQHADKLTEGTKALLKKYPDSFRLDVYPSHRTAIAPQWVYDQVAKNALTTKLIELSSGAVPQNTYGAVPFPIPKSGIEVVWNHQMHWRMPNYRLAARGYQIAPDGNWILIQDVGVDASYPFLQRDQADKWNGEYFQVRQQTFGPAIRSGEAITGRLSVDDDKTTTWVYLTGQRRVRRLPNPCCDTPSTMSAGIATFDEVTVFSGRTNRFDWKLVGKREMLVPYNSNRTVKTADKDLFGDRVLNPQHVRWELHRVWVVDAVLRPGQRHPYPKGRYYFDEDTWMGLLAERYDANGNLARVPFQLPMVASDGPATMESVWGVYDLLGGSSFVNNLMGEKNDPMRPVPAYKDSVFTPDAMASEGVR